MHAQETVEDESEEEPRPLEEIGGTIVYDSQAVLFGCAKIERYFEETHDEPMRKMNPYVLFPR